ncbi:uncharacterized protein si:ch211-194e1.9 isoform X2 [Danio rerio]|uniref:Uncharacterized protein si:ch211-194e1.9 isoform X2 n=1 Tax=Danio rerio TaxID=7955 RepID=A0AC58GC47_DANRE
MSFNEKKDDGGSVHLQPQKAAFTEPSCVSMKSSSSMFEPLKFRDKTVTSHVQLQHQEAACPEPSCMSMKSDSSMFEPLKFTNESVTPDVRVFPHKAACPEPSCVSLKSNSSMFEPLKFEDEKLSFDFIFAGCNLTVQSCEIVASALQSSNCVLRELDLSNNDLEDSGAKLLSDGLKSPNCHLEMLRLSGCMVTEKGCGFLSSALSSNPSHLRELDLSYNHPGPSGVRLLTDKLHDPKCSLKILNVSHDGHFRITQGLQKYACSLTLDPNTAYCHLILTEENKKVTYVEEQQSYPDLPERFEHQEQVLCQEALTGRCYWEVEGTGRVDTSVTYKGIGRKGGSDCRFGYNDKSWSLYCSKYRYTIWHNNNITDIPVPSPPSNRVGVYVDCPAGTLSFYSVSDRHTLTHLHTFNTTFSESLYAGIRVYPDSSVSLC